MIADWILLLVSLTYVAALFAVAYAGDRWPLYPQRAWLRPIVYSLALAVYCSSWTFYGAVGTAVTHGYSYLPIYLGPILVFVVCFAVFRRLVDIGKSHNITSIADFIAARYGKSQGLGAFVTLIAITAAIPYIALQFKAVTMSIDVMSGAGTLHSHPPITGDTAFYVALLLAAFSILFGTRRVDATEHHHGMMLAIALESLVKLVAFVAVGVLGIYHLKGEVSWQLPPPDGARSAVSGSAFMAQTVLAFFAVFCLPRQFQVGVVECENPRDLRTARWLFPVYLAVISVLVVPIAQAGFAASSGHAVPADAYVLWLPLSMNSDVLALVAYLGGFSAATGMVIVASVALATMVSNEIIVPGLLRLRSLRFSQRTDISKIVLRVRRVSILSLSLLAYAYYRLTESSQALASIGLLAFAAVAQFAPAIIGALYWRGGSRAGVATGLGLGFATWIYTLLLPSLGGAGWLPQTWLSQGPFGLDWLRPQALFGVHIGDTVTHGAFWSLLVNVLGFVIVSALRQPSVEDRLRAESFLGTAPTLDAPIVGRWRARATLEDLRILAARIIGDDNARRAFDEHLAERGVRGWHDAAESIDVQFTERLLAGALGAVSARRVLTSALRGTGMKVEEVVALLDRTSHDLRFSRALLSASLENISQGISVVDDDMRLVSWNRRYLELFDYPPGLVHVGRPIADLIRFNAERGECGPGEVAEHVRKRLNYMRQGSPHVFERVRADGTVIEMRGEPLPGGGFVTTFSDVTAYKRAEHDLREANETLEARVAQRTAELAQALEAQRAAKLEAEHANQAKTRFLAAASHDLLQPLNAARLFATALRGSEPAKAQELALRVDSSLRAAEELLDGLLDISRLDAGALRPEVHDFRIHDVLSSVAEQFAGLAETRGLDLRLRPSRAVVHGDRRLLRRIVQNFVANALRYTRQGRVLIGTRRRAGAVEIEVWDTGPGIPAQHLEQIFGEFTRLEHDSPWGERGLGLGLSICQRISRMLDLPLRVRSRPGHGSVFSVQVPLAAVGAVPVSEVVFAQPAGDDLAGLDVLCLDNDRDILDGMRALLQRWSVTPRTAETLEQAQALLRERTPDVLLVDYHLGTDVDGIAALRALQSTCARHIPAALVTADGSDEVKRLARAQGFPLLTKPVKPASLRAFLATCRRSVAA